jgi:hypothetical protein
MSNTPRRGSHDDLFEAVRQLFTSYYYGWTVDQISIRCWPPAAPGQAPQPNQIELPMPSVPPPDLTQLEGDIVDATEGQWLTGKQVAAVIGRKYSGNLRAILAEMTRKGLLEQGAEGYRAKV